MDHHPDPSGNGPLSGLTTQFLRWVADRPRTYGDTMNAWRTSCPRLPVWENALDDGLVQTVNGGPTRSECFVRLTEAGVAAMRTDRAAAHARPD